MTLKESMNVAMIVHNTILSDSRVRKEARTLVENGIRVHLFGLSKTENTINDLDGATLTLVRINEKAKSKSKFSILGVAVRHIIKMLSPGAIGSFIYKRLASYYISYNYKKLSTKLAGEINKHDFKIVHCHDIIGLMTGIILKKTNPNIKLIWDAHEIYTQVNGIDGKTSMIINKIITDSAPKIDYFITINESFKNHYKENYPHLPHATVLMNATKKPGSSISKSNKLRATTGINAKQKILIFQGGFSEGRGIQSILEAAHKLPLDWTIVFMGNGRLEHKIDSYASRLNSNRLEDQPSIVRIPPAPYHELKDWTSGATIGIIPYENTCLNHYYCTPNKLWEYPNAGIPILSNNLIEISELINKYNIGLLLPTNFSSDDIVDSIKSINQEKLNTMTSNCSVFNDIENWEKFEPALLSIYSKITTLSSQQANLSNMKLTGITTFQELKKTAFPPLWMWLRLTFFIGAAFIINLAGYKQTSLTVATLATIQIISHIISKFFQVVAIRIKIIASKIIQK
jgi:glycosyltransferase involved in cell wall biosynthesis